MVFGYIKKHILIIAILNLVLNSLNATNIDLNSYKLSKIDSIDLIIKNIRKEYYVINANISKFKMNKKNIEGESSESGTLIRYYQNGMLRKAIETIYGETGKIITEYYFLDNQLIFEFVKDIRYNVPIYEKNSKIDTVEESRFYFYKNKLVRWIDEKGKIVNEKKYTEKEIELHSDLKSIFLK